MTRLTRKIGLALALLLGGTSLTMALDAEHPAPARPYFETGDVVRVADDDHPRWWRFGQTGWHDDDYDDDDRWDDDDDDDDDDDRDDDDDDDDDDDRDDD